MMLAMFYNSFNTKTFVNSAEGNVAHVKEGVIFQIIIHISFI